MLAYMMYQEQLDWLHAKMLGICMECDDMLHCVPKVRGLVDRQLYVRSTHYLCRDIAARNCIVTQDLTVKITGASGPLSHEYVV